MGSFNTTITVTSSDKDGCAGKLDDLRAYLDNAKLQCEVHVPNHAERKAAREQERA